MSPATHCERPASDHIVKICGITRVEDGLCALEAFGDEPTPEDCAETLGGDLFACLVCYEGEQVGIDPDEGWPLFKPTRIVWIHQTGSTAGRWKEDP